MSKKRVHIRIEHDIMGPVKVPYDAYYGIFTVRAETNFPISGLRINNELQKAILKVKLAGAKANGKLKRIEKKKSKAIIKACEEILDDYDYFKDHFIIDVFQAGAGTPWHMNTNEVIANLAIENLGHNKGDYKVIDPHNDVNHGQSTNDVIPTSIRIASLEMERRLISEIEDLIYSLRKKGKEFSKFIKSGRTHLMDAVPIRLGDDFYAYADDLEKRKKHIMESSKNLSELQIGGSAIGTGLNSHPSFSKEVVNILRKMSKLNLKVAKNKIEETQFMGDLLDTSSGLRSLAVSLNKIANDLRLLSSGPTTGFNEISLPEVEPGSSIMPSKFNPSIPEMLNMVCFQVFGNDEVVREAASAGQLELNVMTPVLAHNLLQSFEILTNGIKQFNDLCVKGIKANKEVLENYFLNNPIVGTVLNPLIGYDKTAELIREAIHKRKSVKELAIQKGIIDEKEADKIFSKKNFGL